MAGVTRTSLLLALLACALCAQPAGATHVACGDRILQDTTLDSDLTCDGDGLYLGGEGVTLDLGGHRLAGVPSEAAPTGISMAAINGTVRNGILRGWGTAVDAGGSNRVTLSGLTFEENDESVRSRAPNVRIVDSRFDSAGEVIVGSGEVTIARNEFVRTPVLIGYEGGPVSGTVSDNLFAGAGVTVWRQGDVNVLGNRLQGGQIRYAFESTGLVRRNTVTGTTVGVLLEGSAHPVVERNVVFGNSSDGIRENDYGSGVIYGGYVPDSTPAVIRLNDVHDNGGNGIEASGGACTRVEGNHADRNRAHGIHMTSTDDPETSCGGTQTVLDNLARRNGLDGIHVDDTTAPVLVRGNRAESNADDGIDVDGLAAAYADPVWAPDGSRIAYAADPVNGPWGVWLSEPDNSDATLLTQGEHPSWSPDGSRLAFSRAGADAGIYTIRADGSGVQQLTTSGTRPQWSPDGSTMLFERGGGLWMVPATGGTATFLTTGADADWSPGGERIAFVDGTDVYVIARDGSGLIWLGEGSFPTWAPDGQFLALVDADQLYVVAADGTGRRRLTAETCSGQGVQCRRDFAPDWSNDGDRILFAGSTTLVIHGDRPLATELFTIRPDGSGLSQLTGIPDPPFTGVPPPLVSDPRWSPDDRAVVFERGRDIYVVPAGGVTLRLTVDTNPLVTVTSNRADRNADLGIEAADDVTDGGGNRARHNGDARQCLNVACR